MRFRLNTHPHFLFEFYRRAVSNDLRCALHDRRRGVTNIDDGIRTERTRLVHHFVVALQFTTNQRFKALGNVLKSNTNSTNSYNFVIILAERKYI